MESKKRLLTLDVFRGFAVAAMILVNNPGNWQDIYYPLRHGDWNDCTFADLVFPFFLFSIGISMAYSFRNALKHDNWKRIKKISIRVVVLFALGMLIAACPLDYWSVGTKIFGTLQKIAIVYAIAAVLCLYLDSIRLVFVSLLILISYWLILYYGGQGDPYSYAGSFINIYETKLFGESRLLFGWANFAGSLSLLPAVVNVLFGYLIGKLVQCSKNFRNLSYKIFFIGLALLLLGKLWEIVLPFNMSLWTSSYIVYSSGWASMIFAFFLWLIEVNGYKKWAQPYKVYGMNPLFIYFISEIWAMLCATNFKFPGINYVFNPKSWANETIFIPLAGYLNGSLLYAFSHVLLFWLIAYIMYKKKVFIKI